MDPTIQEQKSWLRQLGYAQEDFLPMPIQVTLDRVRGLREMMNGNNGNSGMIPMTPMTSGNGVNPGSMPIPNPGSVAPGTLSGARQRLDSGSGFGNGFGGQGMFEALSALRNRYMTR